MVTDGAIDQLCDGMRRKNDENGGVIMMIVFFYSDTSAMKYLVND